LALNIHNPELYDHHGSYYKEDTMDDHGKLKQPGTFAKFTHELKAILNETRKKLKGSDRRRFMAQIVLTLGPGGQSRLKWLTPFSILIPFLIIHLCFNMPSFKKIINFKIIVSFKRLRNSTFNFLPNHTQYIRVYMSIFLYNFKT